jgi:hypothetical protein
MAWPPSGIIFIIPLSKRDENFRFTLPYLYTFSKCTCEIENLNIAENSIYKSLTVIGVDLGLITKSQAHG